MFSIKRSLSIIALLSFLASPALAYEEVFSDSGYVILSSSVEAAISKKSVTDALVDVDLTIEDVNSFANEGAQVEYSLSQKVGLFVGYKRLDINVGDTDVFIYATIPGPHAGVLVRF